MTLVIYIAVMAGVTYLIRMIPFTFFRKKIKYPNRANAVPSSVKMIFSASIFLPP